MSAASQTRAGQTKIFGIRVGIDPKILVGILLALAALLYWYSSKGDEETGSSSGATVSRTETAPPAVTAAATRAKGRRRTAAIDKGALRIRDIDPTRGDVDPTLRLDLISRLGKLKQPAAGRSLFEIGPATATLLSSNGMPGVPKGPKIPVLPPPARMPGAQMNLSVNIPFKFYGFVRPETKGENNRGLFLEGDNILVASEGEILDKRFLVVELTPNSARIEDTQVKQGQTLPVVPESAPQ